MGKVTAIVLAAGKGKRMGTEIAKQYLEVHERPILYYTIQAFEQSDVDEVLVVVGKGEEEYCQQEIVTKYGFKKVTNVVSGGKERYDSVYQGLMAAEDSEYVLIHDGARPCVTKQLINETIEQVKEKKACVVGMPVKDTIKVVTKDGVISDTPDRTTLMITQTPQAFEYEMIVKAYERMYECSCEGVTDDAMVVEMMLKKQVYMMPGAYENIKVTTQEDLKIIEQFLA